MDWHHDKAIIGAARELVDGARTLLARLGATGFELGGEVEVGVPVGALIGPRPYPVVTKAGGFGGPDTLVGAVRALTQGERGG